MKLLILAGGTGTRLWPVSRTFYPKQFTKFKKAGKSTFQLTIEKAVKVFSISDIIIVTNIEYKYFVSGQLHEIGVNIPEDNILLEPEFKCNLFAISYAVFDSLKKSSSHNDNFLVVPSNYMFTKNILSFVEKIKAVNIRNEKLLTFGVRSDKFVTGYGYIKTGQKEASFYHVDKFIEKPSKQDIAIFTPNEYFVNCGALFFTANVFFDELKSYAPEVYKSFISNDIATAYKTEFDQSFEYAVLEQTHNMITIPIGEDIDLDNEFITFYKQHIDYNEEEGNYAQNESVFIKASNNTIYSDQNKTVCIIGVDDLIVIDQPDALLICDRKNTERVGEVVSILKSKGDSRADYHTTCYRPWGSYTVLENGAGYKIKRITVLPGKKLSYQLHHHRSEHWVVVKGVAHVVDDGKDIVINEGESIYISIERKHRLENKSSLLLEIIEVQIGAYLEEDDIVRFDDDYGR